MAVAVLLALLWETGTPTVPLMGAIAVIGGSLGTLSFPAFQGMLASTVPRSELESAVAINSLSLQLARLLGPALAGSFLSALAVAAVGVSSSVPLSIGLAIVGGFCGVVFVALSTVVVQATADDHIRARAMAIWAAALVGLLPLGGLITGGLAAWLGAGGAVLVDGPVMAFGAWSSSRSARR
jgi:Transmembrane secretion effector